MMTARWVAAAGGQSADVPVEAVTLELSRSGVGTGRWDVLARRSRAAVLGLGARRVLGLGARRVLGLGELFPVVGAAGAQLRSGDLWEILDDGKLVWRGVVRETPHAAATGGRRSISVRCVDLSAVGALPVGATVHAAPFWFEGAVTVPRSAVAAAAASAWSQAWGSARGVEFRAVGWPDSEVAVEPAADDTWTRWLDAASDPWGWWVLNRTIYHGSWSAPAARPDALSIETWRGLRGEVGSSWRSTGTVAARDPRAAVVGPAAWVFPVVEGDPAAPVVRPAGWRALDATWLGLRRPGDWWPEGGERLTVLSVRASRSRGRWECSGSVGVGDVAELHEWLTI